MQLKLIGIPISFLIGVLCIRYIRKHDVFEPEPISKMVLVTILGGSASLAICFVMYSLIKMVGFEIRHDFFSAYGIIGPVEEFSKLLGFLLIYNIIKKELNEPIDYIIYISCVSLGFSLVENYFYSIDSENNFYLLFLRILISTPMHIAFSAIMGLSVFLWKNINYSINTVFGAFFYASILHGTFDYLIFMGLSILVLVGILGIYWNQLFKYFSYLSALSPNYPLSEIISKHQTDHIRDKIECIKCDNIDPKEEYKFGKAILYKCNSCGNYVLNRDSLFWLFHYFSGNFASLQNEYKNKGKYYSLYDGNEMDDTKKIGIIIMPQIDSVFDKLKKEARDNFENSYVAKLFLGIKKDNYKAIN